MNKTSEKNPAKYYGDLEAIEGRLHRLIALRIRNAMTMLAYYNKGNSDERGLFDIVDPDEEACTLVAELRFFGLIPDNEAKEVADE